MSRRWTKFQDFYLRFGFLKVLVAVLEKARTSVANELIYRRLRSPLFDPARSHPALWESVKDKTDWHWYAKEYVKTDFRNPRVAEALLWQADCPSRLFAVTRDSEYKILDWARDLEFVGVGVVIRSPSVRSSLGISFQRMR